MRVLFRTVQVAIPTSGRSRRIARSPGARAMGWALALTGLVMIGASTARAQTFVNSKWNGGNGDWNTAGKWSSNAVPANGSGTYYNVYIIGTGKDTVTFDALPTTIESLAVGAGETLQADVPGEIPYYLTIGDPTSPDPLTGELISAGTIDWGNGGILTIGTTSGTNANGASVTNNGALNIDDATLQVNGNFAKNAGSLTLENGSEGLVQGALTSSGSVTVMGQSALDVFGGVNSSGNVTVTPDSLFRTTGAYVTSGGTSLIEGTLKSSGFKISGGNTVVYGILSDSGAFTQSGGDITVLKGATVSASSWDIYGGTATMQGQVLTEPGPFSNSGTLNLQDGSQLTVSGSASDSGAINLGNAVSDSGGNAISISGPLTVSSAGSISLNTPGDSLTSGSLVTSGNLVVNSGSLVDTGSLSNSGSLTVTGCPLGGCLSNSANVTVDGTLTNTGNLTIGSEEAAKQAGVLDDSFVTLQDLQNVYNSGNVTNEAMDTLYFISEAVPGGDFWTSGTDAFAAMVDPAPGTNAPTAQPVNFYNQNGGTVSLQASGEILAVTNGSFYNEAGSTLTLSGGNDLLGAFSFANGGTVKLESGGEEIVAPTITNTGTISIGSGDYVAVKTFDLGSLGTVNATSYSQSAGATTVDGTLYSPAVDISGGKISGDGLIASLPDAVGGTPNPTVMSVTGGTVAPGDAGAPGTLTVDGSYTQGGNASLAIAIDGFGNFSMLDVLGSASLDGSVAFDFGFTPTAGESFTFLTTTPGELSGMFSSDSFSGFSCQYCTLAYNDSAGTVSLDVGLGPPATAAEPGSMALFAAGLLVMGLGIARTRRKSARS